MTTQDGSTIIMTDQLTPLKLNPQYQEQVCTEKPWFYQHINYQMWCFDIFYQHMFFYRVKLIDTNQPFRPWDPELLKYVCDLITESLTYSALQDDEQGLSWLIQKLISGTTDDNSASLRALLKRAGWKMQDKYLILCLSPGKNTGKVNALKYYCQYLQKTLPDSWAIQYDRNLALLVDLTHEYHASEHEFLQRIAEFLREENFRAGISFSFSPLRKASYAYRQASIALEKGLSYDPEIWSYPFSKYRYHYLLDQVCGSFPDYSYFLPELEKLTLYDKKKQTDYVNTLQCYLESNCNMLQAANQLNMHRSTLSYQLKKISKIMGKGIEDTQFQFLLNYVLRSREL